MRLLRFCLAGAALLGLFRGEAARADPRLGADGPPAETRVMPYYDDIPACSDPFVLGQISTDFASREQTWWSSGLVIVDFDFANETGHRSNGLSYIPRRYCDGQAVFSDGAHRRVVYQIAEQTAFLGLGYGVTWCVVGLDRSHAFSPDCRAAGR